MGGRVGGPLRSDGSSGRAEEGAGLGDGRVRRESREERRPGEMERGDFGTGRCRLWVMIDEH